LRAPLGLPQQQYNLLLESVKDYGIFMLDPEGRILSWNEGAKAIKGYSANEIIGQHFSVFYTQEDKQNNKPDKELQIALKKGKYEEEGWRVRKDGSLFWANIIISPVYDADKRHIGFSKVTRDLTERMESDKALKKSNLLYKNIAEELNRTNQDLKQVNEQLEQFASIASHDLKEPLRKILINAEMLMAQSDLSEKGKVVVTKIQDAAERMNQMIEDILELSSISNTLGFENFSLETIFGEAIDLLEETIKEKKAIITSDCLPEGKVIVSQVRQVFLNLIANALKFSKKDIPPLITVTHWYLTDKEAEAQMLKKNKYLLIQFSDNGIGFEQEFTTKIFGVFSRLHSTKEFKGTGLGLAICKKIMETHGGKIYAESEIGEGAKFSLIFPII
jgi:PAS domain S-box-containing protein